MLDWSDGQISVISPDVLVIEPALTITKQAPATNEASARTILYTIALAHATGSTHNAYDVLFEDDLAAE